MSYHRVTGSNDVPLGKIRTFGRAATANNNNNNSNTENVNLNKRTIEETLEKDKNTQNSTTERKRKRKSRWGDDSVKINMPGLPTTLPTGLTNDQLDFYILNLRIEEISQKLRTGDIVPSERSRSPSPEPIYGADGKRINTREYRYRKKLEDERHKLVEDGQKRFPEFKPPADYKKSNKHVEKVWVPSKEFPEINFIGQLLGPRGNTLKKMEGESGAKISIRGKGSIKEGKSRQDGALAPGEEEDLHCLVTADSEEKIAKAVKMIEKIIETAASVPEDRNELKREQLRALAALNGTLRDDETQICSNCGAIGHRKTECPDQKNFTINLICRICGGAGHTARDCMQRNNQDMVAAAQQREQQFNDEYLNLMAELGESNTNTPSATSNTPINGSSGHYGPSATPHAAAAPSSVPPWAANNNSNKTDAKLPVVTAPAPWSKPNEPSYPSPINSNPWSNPTVPPPPGMPSFPPNSQPRIPGIQATNIKPLHQNGNPNHPPPPFYGYNPYYGGSQNNWQAPPNPPNEYAPPPPPDRPPPPPTKN